MSLLRYRLRSQVFPDGEATTTLHATKACAEANAHVLAEMFSAYEAAIPLLPGYTGLIEVQFRTAEGEWVTTLVRNVACPELRDPEDCDA